MKTITCANLFTIPITEKEAYVVTTNGMTKKDGAAVMGAGIARNAAMLFPSLPVLLGRSLRRHGNQAFAYRVNDRNGHPYNVVTMPTKQDWRNPSDIELIKASCAQMVEIADLNGFTRVYMPKPGCRNGGLNWEGQVKPVISQILDDRFMVAL